MIDRPRLRLHAALAASSALFSSSLLPCPAFAQGGADDTVTVTATRTPVRASEVVAEITVLDRAQLDRIEGRTLVEVLSQQAGVQSSSNGGFGKSSSLFIRGLEARHTLLLVDGVRIQSATLGTPSLDNLPLEAIERIEIVRGPLSSLYGNGAMGGVVQIFTRRGGRGLSANFKVAAGSGRYKQGALGFGAGNGVLDAAAQLQTTDLLGDSAANPQVPFGSYNPDRDGFRQRAGSLRLGWQAGADWRVELLNLASRGLTRLDDGPGADARAELVNRNTALSVTGRVLPGWTSRLSLSDATDRYDTLASASAFTPLGAIQTRQRQFGWENTLATPVGTLLVLAERTQERVSRPGDAFSVSERDIDGVALGLTGSAAAHSWQASARRDRNTQFGGVNTGALGYGYAVTPAWRVGASYGTSLTLPSFNQLYFPNFGTPTLIPEEGRHGELSVRWAQAEHAVRAALYRHRYRNFISSGPQPANLPRVEIDGLTLSYEARWWRLVDLVASIDHVDPRNATAGANFDKVLPRRARNAARLAADWSGGAFAAGATLAAFSERFDNAANTARVGGHGVLDLRAEWRFAADLALGIKLNNVADKRYATVLGYDQPGREGFVTLRYAMR